VAYLVGKGRRLDVLSIIKRRDALGLLAHSDTEERFLKVESEITALIQIAFGGKVAEELFFGETSSGVAGDLQAATTAAAEMVGSLGMGGSHISLSAIATPGAANTVAKVLATDEGKEAVNDILDNAHKAVTEMLSSNRFLVEHLRDALLERDELVGEQITEVIAEAYANVIDLTEGKGLAVAE
jgi:ATP-dependent Zn protease